MELSNGVSCSSSTGVTQVVLRKLYTGYDCHGNCIKLNQNVGALSGPTSCSKEDLRGRH